MRWHMHGTRLNVYWHAFIGARAPQAAGVMHTDKILHVLSLGTRVSQHTHLCHSSLVFHTSHLCRTSLSSNACHTSGGRRHPHRLWERLYHGWNHVLRSPEGSWQVRRRQRLTKPFVNGWQRPLSTVDKGLCPKP